MASSSTSPFAILKSPTRRGKMSTGKGATGTCTLNSREPLPHVRSYLFEHQLQNSVHLAEDTWKTAMEEEREAMKNLAASRSDGVSMERGGMSLSRQKPTSRGSKASSEAAEPERQLEQQERSNFNKQMGASEVKTKDETFEYYRTAATTPYIPTSRLQGL